jgi:folate-dependent phosphoribosylglycinamide formyltransferase PurN
MRIVAIVGNHPRHLHIARRAAATGYLVGAVVERREAHLPAHPEGGRPATRALFIEHFQRREAAEHRFFGAASQADFDVLAPSVLQVTAENLNAPRTEAFLRGLAPDVILSYGVHKLSPAIIATAQRAAWNIHGGLSPWYRGTATHFWPSYMLEPQMTGMTLHTLTAAIDGGDVVHQSVVSLHREDGLHDVAARCVSEFSDELPRVLARQAELAEGTLPTSPQRTTGKLWRVSDWRPDHLHVIYDLYGDRVVAHVLDGGAHDAPTPFRANLSVG